MAIYHGSCPFWYVLRCRLEVGCTSKPFKPMLLISTPISAAFDPSTTLLVANQPPFLTRNDLNSPVKSRPFLVFAGHPPQARINSVPLISSK